MYKSTKDAAAPAGAATHEGSEKPSSVRASLLLSQAPSIDLESLRAALSDVLQPAGLVFEMVASRTGLTLCARRLHLCLSAQAKPYSAPALSQALSSRLGEFLGERWQERVDQHDGTVSLTVHAGPAEAKNDEAFPLDGPALRELDDLMLTATHVAAAHLTIANERETEAVLWEPSAQLFSPARFLAMAEMIYPLPLFMHPMPTHDGTLHEGTACISVDFVGASRLLGHGLSFCEAPARLDWLAGRAYAFVAHMRASGTRLRPGDSFGLDEGERIEVGMAPEGLMTLTLKERDGMLVRQPRAAQPA